MTPLRRGWHAVVAIFDFSGQKGNIIFIAAARCLELRFLMWILFSWEFKRDFNPLSCVLWRG